MIKLRFVVPVIACVALAGCGTEPRPQQQPPAQQTTAAVAPATSAAAPANSAPSDQQKQAFLTALTAVDATLTSKADRAVDRGRNICLDLTQAKPDDTVVKNAAQRFGVDQAKAQKIVDAAKRSLCPK